MSKTKSATMNISLPAVQKAFVERQVAKGQFGSASDYVRELIRRDQRQHEREDLERRLLIALESPKREMTKADWRDLREQVTRRLPPS